MSQSARFCSRCGTELSPGAAFCPKCGAPVGQAASPAQQGAPMSGVDALMKEPAAQGYWLRRLIAYVVDIVIIVVVLIAIGIGIAVPAFFALGTAGFVAIFAGLFSVVAGVITFFYFIVAEVVRGGTIGKRVFNLRVVGPSGGNPTFLESIVRNISKIHWVLLLLDVVVGLATSKKYTQKFSDSLVGTSVVG